MFRNPEVTMPALRLMILVLTAAFGLSACMMTEAPSRAQMGEPGLLTPDQGFAVKAVHVSVPRSLVVSEENSYLPMADIVWHGEAQGDRYQQVGAIFATAMARGTYGFYQGRPVVLDVVVTRFHALTDKTRRSIGGRHNLKYDLTLRDAETGAMLGPVRHVNASVHGAGGAQALAEDRAGRTQKVVITQALVNSIQQELSQVTPHRSFFGNLVARASRRPALDLPR